MDIQLKNIKYSAFASQETSCYMATIYIDGVKVGTVENDGNGGCDFVHPQSVADRIDEYAKTLPKKVCAWNDPVTDEPMLLEQSHETIFSDLIDQYLQLKSLKRQCAKKTLFRKCGETYADGEYHSINRKYCPQIKEWLMQKFGAQVEILNEQI